MTDVRIKRSVWDTMLTFNNEDLPLAIYIALFTSSIESPECVVLRQPTHDTWKTISNVPSVLGGIAL